jgi:hypothetical protein
LFDHFRQTIETGGYNMLLGSGVSLTSRNGAGQALRSMSQLQGHLCSLTAAKESTTLSRVYGLLTADQIERELVVAYSCANASEHIVRILPRYIWKRAFTFNIDDVLEVAYERSSGRKQALELLTFESDFQPGAEDHSRLQLIHLHGSVRAPAAGFVFSYAEYARMMSKINPWMVMLSQIIATEPFIISGTSLNEIDLEYYLSHRTAVSPRKGRGPSLLIEPFPDSATRSDCERYGLTLVEATFDDFREWLCAEIPNPPSIISLLAPSRSSVFPTSLPKLKLLRFFSDFELASVATTTDSHEISRFLYGAEPSWEDIARHIDIERTANSTILQAIDSTAAESRIPFLVIFEDAATGKTTICRRVAHDLARRGRTVFNVKTFGRIDTKNAVQCLETLTGTAILCVDDLADHAEQLREIAVAPSLRGKLIIAGFERRYRRDYIDLILADCDVKQVGVAPFARGEYTQLVEQYRQYGLLGATDAIRQPTQFVRVIEKDPIAVAVCRILNDFRPLDGIIDSLWKAAAESSRIAYLTAAVARFCYWGGLRYEILQAAVGVSSPLHRLMDPSAPLPLSTHPSNDEFVVPQNALVAERVLWHVARVNRPLMMRVFTSLAEQLAPYVNRLAIKRRSPESRVTGRLFDSDTVVRPFLGENAPHFYEAVKPKWDWNSRYWEQRALDMADEDLPTAIQYARHAVAVEEHPFPLTTLSKLLLQSIGNHGVPTTATFSEAFENLMKAMKQEATNVRVTAQPFMTLINGTCNYLKLSGSLSLEQRIALHTFVNEARYRFRNDPRMMASIAELDRVLQTPDQNVREQ